MNSEALFRLLDAARTVCGHREYVVIGSLSALGMEQVSVLPADMTMSIDADCFTPADPERVFDLKPVLGEGSEFHRQHGYYLDPVSPLFEIGPGGGGGWNRRAEKHQPRRRLRGRARQGYVIGLNPSASGSESGSESRTT